MALVALLALGLLAAIDHATDQDDLVAWVVLDGESEGVVGLDLSIGTLAVLLTVLLVVILLLLVLLLGFLDLLLDAGLGTGVGRADTLLGHLDGGLMDQLVQVQLLLLLLFLLLLANAGEVGLVAVEGVLDTLLHQGLLGVQLVGDLELGQLHLRVLLLLIAIVQELLQLLAVLDLLLLDLGQTVLLLGHDHVHGQLLLLGWDADNLDLIVFVVVEAALALDGLALLGLLASQWVESGLLGGLLLTELTSPLGLQLQSADGHHLGVVGDGVLRNDVLDLLAGLGGDQLVDLLTALLWAGLERAFLDLTSEALLHGLDELTLSAGLLVDDDAGGAVDLGLLLAVVGLSGLLGLLHVVGSLEAADHGGVGLLALFLGQTGALGPLHLSLGVALGALLQSGQSQLDGDGRDDGVLVIAFLLGLLVQLGGDLAVGLLELLKQLVVGLARASLGSLALGSEAPGSLALGSSASGSFALGSLALLVVLIFFVLALLTIAAGLLAVVVIGLTVVLVVFVVVLAEIGVLLLGFHALEQLVEALLAVVGAARRGKAQKSNQNDETHFRRREETS